MRAILRTFASGILGTIVACSGGSDHSASGSQVAIGGSGGNADSAPGGSAGFSPIGNGGADLAGGIGGAAVGGHNGGSAGVSAAGSVATGGVGGAGMTALDPSLPTPSHDCRSDTSSANCISIAGTYAGAAIDTHCTADNDLSVSVHAGEWVIGCDHLSPGFARLYVPIQRPGSFALTATRGSKPNMEFEFSATSGTTSVLLDSDNLVSAQLAGSVVVVSAPYRTVSGTFHGNWGQPDSACTGLSGSTCAVTNINITFRISTRFGSCFSDSECTPPQTCDSVADACFG